MVGLSRGAGAHRLRGVRVFSASSVCLVGLLTAGAAGAGEAVDFQKQVVPLLERYCVGCHSGPKKKGDLALDYRGRDAGADRESWRSVAERLESGEMPPEEKQPRPGDAEVDLILRWIDQAAGRTQRDPGRVTIRRLNRAEYNNTVRDLLGVDMKPAQDFPSDDVGYGFDNIGDVLTVPPVLFERYMAAAEQIAERAIVVQIPPRKQRHVVAVDVPVLNASRKAPARLEIEVRGEYVLKIRAAGRPVGGRVPRMGLRLDGKELATVEVPRRGTFATNSELEAGPHRLEVTLLDPQAKDDGPAASRLSVQKVTLEGPLPSPDWHPPESHTRLIPRAPDKVSWRQDAREFLGTLATRAYRRPARPDEVERLARLVEQTVDGGESFERGMQLALRAVLISPHFLYQVELDPEEAPPQPGLGRPLDDWELATRLSYFLWSSMPDEQLFARAADGSLHRPEVLEAEARRLLANGKAKALVQNFATQWLQIRNLAGHRADRKRFPGFDDELRTAMARETELFFEAVMREDLSVRTFIDADFTFLNQRLARHYGIEGVEGSDFRKVALKGGMRGGVLTQASVLTVTSNPTRTSPVKRGRWVLEQLLGTPPPPPPPGVPELKTPDKSEHPTSVRQRLELHRSDPACAACHKKMDPLGFGLENFDAVGVWRDQEAEAPVDATGVLPNGQRFHGPAELKAVLLTKEKQFRRSLATKLLTYALGRGTEPYDRAAIDEICEKVAGNGDRFSSMILAIVKSDPFQKRRGPEVEP
jgi:hypothetical protein